MPLGSALDIGASALHAQRQRMEIIASNLANAQSTGSEPYRRQIPVLEPAEVEAQRFSEILRHHSGARPQGVRMTRVVEDPSLGAKVFDPGHPDADEEGFVLYPNVDPVAEMVTLLSAVRAYESNATVIEVVRTMMQRALDIGRA